MNNWFKLPIVFAKMSYSNNGPCPSSVNARIFKKYTEAGFRLDNTNLFRAVMVMFLRKKILLWYLINIYFISYFNHLLLRIDITLSFIKGNMKISNRQQYENQQHNGDKKAFCEILLVVCKSARTWSSSWWRLSIRHNQVREKNLW